MDWSPVFISMKTASLSILITFFLGLIVAWGIVKMKHNHNIQPNYNKK